MQYPQSPVLYPSTLCSTPSTLCCTLVPCVVLLGDGDVGVKVDVALLDTHMPQLQSRRRWGWKLKRKPRKMPTGRMQSLRLVDEWDPHMWDTDLVSVDRSTKKKTADRWASADSPTRLNLAKRRILSTWFTAEALEAAYKVVEVSARHSRTKKKIGRTCDPCDIITVASRGS